LGEKKDGDDEAGSNLTPMGVEPCQSRRGKITSEKEEFAFGGRASMTSVLNRFGFIVLGRKYTWLEKCMKKMTTRFYSKKESYGEWRSQFSWRHFLHTFSSHVHFWP